MNDEQKLEEKPGTEKKTTKRKTGKVNFKDIRTSFNLKHKNRTTKDKALIIKRIELRNNSCVTNLSEYKLDYHELRILNKGLNFIHSDNYTDNTKNNIKLVENFERKLQIKLFFDKCAERSKIKKDIPNDKTENHINKTKIENIKIVTNWYPPNPNTFISAFCNQLKCEIKNINHKFKNTPNIDKNEFTALQKLRKNKNIVIKAADKAGGIVVLNTIDYEEKMFTHLQSNSTYLKTTEDLFTQEDLLSKYRMLTNELKPYLSKKQFNWLNDVKNELGIIYGLPKIHKPGHPLRPIISQCNSLTNKLHIYLQQALKIGEAQIPNLIKDTTDFLNKIKQYSGLITQDTILVTMDVESLYTNIPLDLGIELIVEHYIKTLKYWKQFEIDIKPIPAALLKRILEFTLKNCYFIFNGNIYKQMQGLTMGGASSVQNANIIMFKFFERFNQKNPNLIWTHNRFIDDLFGIWNKTSVELNEYFDTLNNFHPNFKFTLNQSKIEIPFLDVKVKKINMELKSTIYTKPTDKKLYLNFASNHTLHTKKSIPFSQLLRLKRIVSDPIELKTQITLMTNAFRLRNYPEVVLNNALIKLEKIDRDTLFKYKTKVKKIDRPILILIYENKYDKHNILKRTFNKLWTEFLSEHPEFHKYFPTTPMLTYKNGKSIKKTLISSKYPVPWHLKRNENQKTDSIDELNILNLLALLTE